MKNKLLIIFVLFLLTNCFAQIPDNVRPNQIKSIMADVILKAEGEFTGEISEGDRTIIKILSFSNSENQNIEQIQEKLIIGDIVYNASSEFDKENNRYAVFEINDLKKHSQDPNFLIEINAKVRTNSWISISSDQDIGEPIESKEKYLEPTPNIESDDPELMSKASMFKTDSVLETITNAAQWVNTNIVYDLENYYDGTWSAKETYNSRKGVCDEFANLTAAFLRPNGIPAKYIIGISYDGRQFGNHGWLEAYVNDRWIGVDSTYGEAGYIDGAHIMLGQTTDAENIANLSATTWTKKSVQINTILHDPIVTIEDIELFSDLVELEFLKPEEVISGEEFRLQTKLKNTMSNYLVIPITLLLRDEFQIMTGEKNQLVLLKPQEEKFVNWFIKSPQLNQTGMYANYDMLLLTNDHEIQDKISVVPEKKTGQIKNKEAQIEILDISPFIEKDLVKIDVTVENKGDFLDEFFVNISSDVQIGTYKEKVEPRQKTKFTYELSNIPEGTILNLVVKSNYQQKNLEIPILKKEGKLDSEEILKETPKTETQPDYTNYLVIGLGIVVIIFILNLFFK